MLWTLDSEGMGLGIATVGNKADSQPSSVPGLRMGLGTERPALHEPNLCI